MKEEKSDRRSSKPNLNESANSYLKYSSIAFEVSAFAIIAIWGGYALSKRFSPDTHWIMIVDVFFASGGIVYYLYKRLNS